MSHKPKAFVVQEIEKVQIDGVVDYAKIRKQDGSVRLSLGTLVDVDSLSTLRNSAGRSSLRVYEVKPGSTVYRRIRKSSSIKPQKPEKRPVVSTGRRQARIALRR